MSRDRIPCSACHGHGEVELPKPHRQTLGQLSQSGEWLATSAVLRRHVAVPRPRRTALINRLNALVRWGLVDRRGNGRSLEWRRV